MPRAMKIVRKTPNPDAHKHVRLGQLIDILDPFVRDPTSSEQAVYIEPFHMAWAGDVFSYRGYYEQLAIDFIARRHAYCSGQTRKGLTIADFSAKLKEALSGGVVFEGYKGGQYKMHENTPLWVGSYGRCDGGFIESAHQTPYGLVLVVASDEVGSGCDCFKASLQPADDDDELGDLVHA